MRTTMRTMRHVALAAMAAAGLALAGCGGSSRTAGVPGTPAGGQPTQPAPKSLDLSSLDDDAIMAGILTIAAGESGKLGGVTYSCPAGGEACVVTVGEDKMATYTGGMPTVMLTPPADETPPASGTPPADDTPPASGTPPADDTPPASGTPPADETPPASGTPPADDTPLPSLDVAKLFAALEDRILGADDDDDGQLTRQLPIDQYWDLNVAMHGRNSAMHGRALGLVVGADWDKDYKTVLRAELPLTSVKLPALHGWAGTRATGSDDRYEHTLVLYTDLEAPTLDGTTDERYTVFGWWLRKDKQDGTLAFKESVDVRYWSTGHGTWVSDDAVTVTVGVTDTATYAGAAAGMYALKREGQTDEAGEWTAKATVTAAFGDNTALGTVKGTITEFMVGGERRNWKVDLEQYEISNFYGRTAWTIDEAKDATPDRVNNIWGNYYYNSKGTPGGADSQPTSVYGDFSVKYGTEGHMDGAFAAHKN